MNPETERPVDFRPVAEPGWRVIFAQRDEDGAITTDIAPLAGWLIAAEIDGETGAETGWRTTYAAHCDDDGEVHPVISRGDYYAESSTSYVRGPGEDDPTDEKIAADLDKKARRVETMRRADADGAR